MKGEMPLWNYPHYLRNYPHRWGKIPNLAESFPLCIVAYADVSKKWEKV